ncbi:MAG TPA: tail fiber protein [Jatrophihabitans sp.]|nr:tail fiber protein [Jatrophihabitans sp.]
MSNPYIGEIRIFCGNFAPVGWLLCQGQSLAISDYDTLFNLIGTTYGGDGVNTFNLPNLQSRIPVHQGSGYPLAMTGGAEQVVLSQQNLPTHTHPVLASSQVADQTSPANNFWGTSTMSSYSDATPTATMSPNSLALSGGNQPHDNMPPFLVVNFIISLFGIYPSPS